MSGKCATCQALEAEQDQLKASIASASAALDDLVAPDESKPLDQRIRDEFHDFKMILDHCTHVYYHVTNGRISKPNTIPEDVCRVADDLEMERTAEAIKEETADMREQLSALQAVLAEIEPYLHHQLWCAFKCRLSAWPSTRRCQNGNLGCEVDHSPGCTCGLDSRLAGLRGIR